MPHPQSYFKLPFLQNQIQNRDVSVPQWDLLTDPNESVRNGIIRHDVPQVEDAHIPRKIYQPMVEHLKFLLSCSPFDFSCRSDVLLLTLECWLNVLTPMFLRRCSPRALYRPDDEPLFEQEYSALLGLVGKQLSIKTIRFVDTADGPHAVIVDEPDEEIEFAAVGPPILRRGKAVELAVVAGLSADFRHLWELYWEQWTEQRYPKHAGLIRAHREIHDRMQQHFMQNLEGVAAAERGAFIVELAEKAGLAPSKYYRASIGTSPSGANLILLGNGTLRDFSSWHQDEGMTDAILVGSGGGAGLDYHISRNLIQRSPNQRLAHPPGSQRSGQVPDVRVLARSPHYRGSHAALAIQLKSGIDVIDAAFDPH